MRYTVRLLMKKPIVTAVAVLSLALGIGGNTLMFSIVHAVLIRSLPYVDSDRLVFIWFTPPGRPDQKRPAAFADFLALREQSRVLEHIGTVGGIGEVANLTSESGADAEQLRGQRFSPAIPDALGAKPMLGRWFTEADAELNNPVVVISYALWQSGFALATDIVGKTIQLDGEETEIIGVMPKNWMLFNYPAQYWAPERFDAIVRASPNRTHVLAARMKAGISLAQAQDEMNRIAAGLSEEFRSSNQGWGILLEPALSVYVGWVRKPLLIVQAVVGLVLLIACANVAGLLLADATSRKKEVAVRFALGAGRWQIVRQFLTESVLLSLLGALAGIALAHIGLKLFIISGPAWFPRVGEIVLDTRMLGFTVLVALGTALLFGLIPAMQVSRPDLVESLKAMTALASRGVSQQRLRNTLVVLQLSVAFVVLIAAGLMVNTFARLYSAPLGCDCMETLTFQVRLPRSRFAPQTGIVDGQKITIIHSGTNGIFEQIRDGISHVPGVNSAAAGVRPLFSEMGLSPLMFPFMIADRAPRDPGEQTAIAVWFPVSPGYFRTLGVPILRGREFGSQDTAASVPTVVINETLARRYWAGEDPLGQRLRIDIANEPSREIVGVVGDLRHNRHDREASPQIYIPFVQQSLMSPDGLVESRLSMTYVVRSTGDPLRLVAAIRDAVARVDRSIPVFNVKTVKEYVDEQLWQPRQTMSLLVVFSGIAIVLAMTGIYGIIAYTVQQRTQEIGIRMALGARSLDVFNLVMTRGVLLVVSGVVIGIVASLGLTRTLESLLWGVAPTDVLTYALVIAGLLAVALLACYAPARRALKVDPSIALRCE